MEQPTVENQTTRTQLNPEKSNIYHKWKTYYQNVKTSDSYMFRFFNTLLVIQALCLLMFVTFRFLLLLDEYRLVPFAAIGFLILGIFVICRFLIFTWLEIKAGTYLFSSIIYFGISLLLASKVGLTFTSLDGIMADTFTGVLSFWNLVFAVIIFSMGCIRTFFLGLIHDYRKK